MKTYFYTQKSIFFIFLLSLFLVFSCSNQDSDDPCDETVKPEIQVSLKATVTVFTKDNEPIPDQQLNLNIYKIPCGSEAKGNFNFDGPTNDLGIRTTTVVNYNLRNADDEVWVDVHAVNLGNGSASADSEYVIFKYGDFTSGVIKEVHVYIYRNF